MRKKTVVLITILLSGLGFAAENYSGKTGLSFLKVGVDARASGMAGAYTAVSKDVSAVHWNPAGLVRAQNSNVMFNHNKWVLDSREEFAGLSFIRQKSAWGFHLRSFNIGDIQIREIPSAEPLENTTAHYFSAGMSYARQLNSNFDIGVTLKYLFEKIYIEDASGFAFDFGFLYRTGFKNLEIGAAVQNIGQMNTFKEERTKLPTLGRLGVMFPVHFTSSTISAILAADLVKVIDENIRFHAGTELILWNQLALRTGIQAGYESHSLNFGIGIMRAGLRLSYAILPFEDDLGTSHQFTLGFDI